MNRFDAWAIEPGCDVRFSGPMRLYDDLLPGVMGTWTTPSESMQLRDQAGPIWTVVDKKKDIIRFLTYLKLTTTYDDGKVVVGWAKGPWDKLWRVEL